MSGLPYYEPLIFCKAVVPSPTAPYTTFPHLLSPAHHKTCNAGFYDSRELPPIVIIFCPLRPSAPSRFLTHPPPPLPYSFSLSFYLSPSALFIVIFCIYLKSFRKQRCLKKVFFFKSSFPPTVTYHFYRLPKR